LVLDDRCQFIGFVTDTTIVSDGHPTLPAYGFQPGFVWAVGRKVICMSFHLQASGGENFGEAFP